MAEGMLGCAEDYRVALHDSGGEVPIGPVLEPTRVEWSRLIDDTSEGTATFAAPDPDCCDILGDAEPWCHDLSIYRDEELVWQGPLLTASYDADNDTITLAARDVTGWLDRRWLHNPYDFTASGLGAMDLATIAERLLRDAYGPDDPNVLDFLTVFASGVVGERSYETGAGPVGDDLRELARTGLDFTTIGRRIILFGAAALGQLATLDDEAFAGGMRITKDGTQALSRALVKGTGVQAVSGGIGVCGLLERVFSEESILDTASAQAEADARVAAGTPTPVFLEVPDNARLVPDAPVTVAQLVPGVLIPVASSLTCLSVAATLRLTKVTGTFTPADGEQIGVTLAPPGVEDN